MPDQSETFKAAIRDGYVRPLIFVDGHLCCPTDPQYRFPIAMCFIQPKPDLVAQLIVYRIICPDGCKAHAIVCLGELEKDD